MTPPLPDKEPPPYFEVFVLLIVAALSLFQQRPAGTKPSPQCMAFPRICEAATTTPGF